MASNAPISNDNAKLKTIYFIRHAESQENRRLKSLKAAARDVARFAWPRSIDLQRATELCRISEQIDSPVSEFGQQQIKHMANVLREANFIAKIQVVAHSPLRRAMDTSFGLLGCRAPDAVPEGIEEVIQLDLLQEKTPVEWIGGGDFPQRLVALHGWLATQSADAIALVGHSQFFKALLQQESLMGNCDVVRAHFDPSNKVNPWSNMETVYTCGLQAEDTI